MTYIFIGRIAQAVLALIALRAMTEMLSPEEVGRWSLLIATTSFFVLGLVNPVGMFINRRLHSWVEHGKIQRYMMYYCLYLIGVSFFAAVLISIGSRFYSFVPNLSLLWLILFIVVSIIFTTLNQTFIPSLNLLAYRGWFVLLTLATIAISLLISVGLVYYLEPSAELWQMGQLTGQFFMALVGGMLFFSLAKKHQVDVADVRGLRLTKEKRALLFSFAWPLAISVLLTWVQTQSYRFIAQDSIGLEALGLFVMGYGISAAIIAVFESIISGYFIPMFYKKVSSENKDDQTKAWASYASTMLPSLCLMVGLIIASPKELTFVLLDERFSQASQYVLWGSLAEAARVIVGTYALSAHAGMNTKKLMLPNTIAAIAAPAIIFMLIGACGVAGVGLGLVVVGGIAVVSNHVILSKSFHIIMPWMEIVRAIAIAALFLAVSMLSHSFWGAQVTWGKSLVWLGSLGFLLFVALYFMLKDAIYREVEH